MANPIFGAQSRTLPYREMTLEDAQRATDHANKRPITEKEIDNSFGKLVSKFIEASRNAELPETVSKSIKDACDQGLTSVTVSFPSFSPLFRLVQLGYEVEFSNDEKEEKVDLAFAPSTTEQDIVSKLKDVYNCTYEDLYGQIRSTCYLNIKWRLSATTEPSSSEFRTRLEKLKSSRETGARERVLEAIKCFRKRQIPDYVAEVLTGYTEDVSVRTTFAACIRLAHLGYNVRSKDGKIRLSGLTQTSDDKDFCKSLEVTYGCIRTVYTTALCSRDIEITIS